MKSISAGIILIVVFQILGCSDDAKIIPVAGNDHSGRMYLSMTNVPGTIVKVVACLSRYGYSNTTLTLTVADVGGSASGTMNNIPPGVWHLKVDALDSAGTIRLTGEKDVEIAADQTALVEMLLLPLTGSIEIHVVWGGVCTAPPPGVVSWWPAEGNALDIRGGNSGVVEGGTTFTTGRVGKAFHFDGISGRIRIPDSENLKITGSLSIEAWIFIESFPASWSRILFRGDDRDGYDAYSLYVMNLNSGILVFTVGDSVGNWTSLSTGISTGRYIHVAATFDSSTGNMSLYMNGSLCASRLTSVRPMRNLDPRYSPGVGIGNVSGVVYNQPFHGYIDEPTLYRRTLSADEIFSIYTAGSGGKCK